MMKRTKGMILSLFLLLAAAAPARAYATGNMEGQAGETSNVDGADDTGTESGADDTGTEDGAGAGTESGADDTGTEGDMGDAGTEDGADDTGTEGGVEGSDGITLNGHTFNLAETIPDDRVPQDFTKTEVSVNGRQVEGLSFDKADLTLIYLTTPSTEVKNTLAVYDGASGAVYPFRKVEAGGQYIILLEGAGDAGVPPRGSHAGTIIGEYGEAPAFVTDADPDFAYVYAASSQGNLGWYRYDTAEGTFQRCAQADMGQADTPEMMEEGEDSGVSVEMQGLQKAYKELESKYTEERGRFKKIVAGMIFLAAVLIVIILNLILRRRTEPDPGSPKPRKRKAYEEAEDWEEEEPGTQKPGKPKARIAMEEEEPGGQRPGKPKARIAMEEEEPGGQRPGKPKAHMPMESWEGGPDLARAPREGKAPGAALERQEAAAPEKTPKKKEPKKKAPAYEDDDFEIIDLEDL